MPGYTTSFLFPDINVWVALTHAGHVHHDVASDWFSTLDDDTRLHFCRVTQLGFLRLLTAQAVMGSDVLTQSEAWQAYDHWHRDHRVTFIDEPVGMDRRFRSLTRLKTASPKHWADAYLLALAETAQLTLVTFDQAFAARTKHVLLLAE